MFHDAILIVARALQFDLNPGQWDNHFSRRQRRRGGSPHPFHRWQVTVHQHHFARSDLLDIIENRLPRSVSAELELLDMAAKWLGWFVFVERDQLVRLSATENSRGRLGIS